MIRNIALIAGLVLSNLAFAAEQNNSAVISDKENAVMIASNKTTWSVVATNNSKGLTKVREFHDMGASGIQQIDYVVNCADQTMALAAFSVLTDKGRLPVRASEPTFADLSFYKPMIDHDKAIANNTCEKRLAMNGVSMSN
jgi:hypothetical protein